MISQDTQAVLNRAYALLLRDRDPALGAATGQVINHLLHVDHYDPERWYFIDAYGIYPMLPPAASES